MSFSEFSIESLFKSGMQPFCIFLVLLICVPASAETNASSERELPAKYSDSGNNTLEMSLVEAVSIGLRHSRQIKMTYMDRVMEKFDLAESRRKFYPNITMDGDLNIDASRTDTDYNEQDPTHEHSETRSATVTPKVVQELPTGGELLVKYAWDHSNEWSRDNTGWQDTWSNEGTSGRLLFLSRS